MKRIAVAVWHGIIVTTIVLVAVAVLLVGLAALSGVTKYSSGDRGPGACGEPDMCEQWP